MPNQNRNKQNQPPTGEGKKQSPQQGQDNKLSKRSEVGQAQRNHPEENYGSVADEEGLTQEMDQGAGNAKRQKAGR
jgi:hypothetical protein